MAKPKTSGLLRFRPVRPVWKASMVKYLSKQHTIPCNEGDCSFPQKRKRGGVDLGTLPSSPPPVLPPPPYNDRSKNIVLYFAWERAFEGDEIKAFSIFSSFKC